MLRRSWLWILAAGLAAVLPLIGATAAAAGVVWGSWPGGGGVGDELAEGARECRGLVAHDERVAVGDFDEARVGEQCGEALPVLGPLHPVFGGPDDERGPVKRRKPLA